MRRLRVGWKLIALTVTSVAFYLFLVISAGSIDAWGRLRGRRGASFPWRATVFRTWARAVGRLIRLQVEVQGPPPRPPFILVANHLGYVDVVMLATQLRAVFVARADVNGWPVIGHICRAVNTLFIDRGIKRDIPRVMRRMEEILASGVGVVIFPEGTSTRGDKVLPFRPSLLETAARSGREVSYAALGYRTPPVSPPAHLSVCWWGDMMFTPHVLGLLELKSFRGTIGFGEKPIAEMDRKVLATRLREAVQRRFQPVATTPEEE